MLIDDIASILPYLHPMKKPSVAWLGQATSGTLRRVMTMAHAAFQHDDAAALDELLGACTLLAAMDGDDTDHAFEIDDADARTFGKCLAGAVGMELLRRARMIEVEHDVGGVFRGSYWARPTPHGLKTAGETVDDDADFIDQRLHAMLGALVARAKTAAAA